MGSRSSSPGCFKSTESPVLAGCWGRACRSSAGHRAGVAPRLQPPFCSALPRVVHGDGVPAGKGHSHSLAPVTSHAGGDRHVRDLGFVPPLGKR